MNVLILGLGQYENGSGVAAALYFAKRGDRVLVTDPKSANELGKNPSRLKRFKNVELRLGKAQKAADVAGMDLVVRNPRVPTNLPPLKAARKKHIPIVGDVSVFLDNCPCPVVGITGTRGKSTTTTLLWEMLRASKKWRKVWLGGNILVSPLTFIDDVKKEDIVVLELSSWQTEILGEHGVSPDIALWTNFMRDHLNVHESMEDYAEAKAQIFRHQRPQDHVFLPADAFFNDYAKTAAGAVHRWGKKGSEETHIVNSAKMKIGGEHNRLNAMAAAAVARGLGVSKAVIKKSLESFNGIPNRQEVLRTIKGVRFVNDTTATTPDATIAAVKRFSEEGGVKLIFGGADKELEFDEIAKRLAKIGVRVALLPGTAEKKIKKAFKAEKVDYFDVKNLKDAVAALRKEAKAGDAIILSPGCASFGLFKNEFDRGDQFRALVKKL